MQKRKKIKQKCYVVFSADKRRQGAFPHTEEGLEKANNYVKILKAEYNENFIIGKN